jgi:tripartite-type tricarboxylate transporter receptor subunit TctC
MRDALRLRSFVSRGVLLTVLAAGLSAAAHADPVDFSGDRIEAIVPFAEGGGGDSYMRYMAKVLEPFLPGQPSIVVRNVPGGGSVVGANYFQSHAKDDGTTIAIASTSTTLTYALRPDDPDIQFQADKWKAFVASPVGRVMYINSSTGVKTLEDLKALGDKELLIGLQSPTGSDMPTLLSYELLGINAKPVFGMDGGDAHMAFQRGELHLNGDVTPAYLQMAVPLVKEGTAVPLFTFGFQDASGQIVRDPNFPELPTFIEAYRIMKGEEPSGPGFEAWKVLFQMAVMSSKVLVLPESASPEVVAAYDEAIQKLVKDPKFQAESGQFIGSYPQLTGEQARQSLVGATTISKEAREWLVNWLKTEFNAEL